MTVTVWYKQDIDQVIENVKSISPMKDGSIQIKSTDDGLEMIDIITMDADTYITIGKAAE